MAQKRQRHVPQRTCVACREKFDKRRLTRLVATGDGQITIDPSGKQPGRGAYLCERLACWERAVHSNLLDRALKVKIAATAKKALADFQPQQGHRDEGAV
jgi:predicted RNA-binding protein YlxR (DUF448 family)